MNQIFYQQTAQTLFIPEQRNNGRHHAVHLLAITPKGTGQIINISKDGLSFGCLYPHFFQDEWFMDILDAKGSHIKQLKVLKTWEREPGHPHISDKFDMEIGIEFTDLTYGQIHELDILIARCSPLF